MNEKDADGDAVTRTEGINQASHGLKSEPKSMNSTQNAIYDDFIKRDDAWHQDETKKLLRKVDLHLLPLLVLMYLLNFLDRKYVISRRM
jgi:hypothetical protein